MWNKWLNISLWCLDSNETRVLTSTTRLWPEDATLNLNYLIYWRLKAVNKHWQSGQLDSTGKLMLNWVWKTVVPQCSDVTPTWWCVLQSRGVTMAAGRRNEKQAVVKVVIQLRIPIIQITTKRQAKENTVGVEIYHILVNKEWSHYYGSHRVLCLRLVGFAGCVLYAWLKLLAHTVALVNWLRSSCNNTPTSPASLSVFCRSCRTHSSSRTARVSLVGSVCKLSREGGRDCPRLMYCFAILHNPIISPF